MEIVLLNAFTFKLEASVKQCEKSYINRYINFYRCGYALHSNASDIMHAQKSGLRIYYREFIIILEY